MIAQPALGRPQCQMVLHPVTGEHLDRSVIAMDGQSHRHGSFRELDAVPLVRGYLQIVGHQIELLASHLKRRMVVYLHRLSISKKIGGGKMK